MFRNAYQRGMLTVFFSCGSKPLGIWETHTKNGYITRFLDQDIKSMVLEIGGTNISTTYMICPQGKQVLGINMPFLVMIVKNLKKYFSFEVTVLDETSTRRRFRVSNFQSTTQILPLCTVMPIGLSEGWNQIQFNLAEFTRRAYNKQFIEVQKLKINANIRLRRIYFTENLIPEDQLPPEYKLYFPLVSKGKRKILEDVKEKDTIAPLTSSSKQAIIVGPGEDRKMSKAEVTRSGSKGSVQIVKRISQEDKSKTNIEDVPEPLPAEAAPVEEKPAEVEATAEGEAPQVKVSAEVISVGDSTIPDGTPSESGAPSELITDGESAVAEVEDQPAESEASPAEVEAPPEAPAPNEAVAEG